MSIRGDIFDIKRFATHDGPGIRTTVFLRGCPLRCWWCHNPEAFLTPEAARGSGDGHPLTLDGVERGVAGHVDTAFVMDEVLRDAIFYDRSGGGVTISGGEPLMQPGFVREILRAARREGLHTALDTSGHGHWDHFSSILDDVDLVLFDLKLIDDNLHRQYTGISNQRILENLRKLHDATTPVQLRLPLIPGITSTRENLSAIVELLRDLPRFRNISLLPYHRAANAKYERLGMDNPMPDTPPHSVAEIEACVGFFENAGFTVKVGG